MGEVENGKLESLSKKSWNAIIEIYLKISFVNLVWPIFTNIRTIPKNIYKQPMSQQESFDIAVLGLGIIGSSTLNYLADFSGSFIGIDQYHSPHDLGSSHGETRLLRVAYAENPAYVPMVRRSIRLWQDLEAKTRKSLFVQSGVLYSGLPKSNLIKGVQKSSKQCQVDLIEGAEFLSEQELKYYSIPKDWQFLYESEGGFLKAEDAISAYLGQAQKSGGKLLFNTKVLTIEPSHSGWIIKTQNHSIKTQKVIVTLGAWAADLLPNLKGLLTLKRKVMHWYKDINANHTTKDGFLPILAETVDEKSIYVIPAVGIHGVKVAEHTSGTPFSHPSIINRNIDLGEDRNINNFVRDFLPRMGSNDKSSVCMYTMTPDDKFIIDRHPQYENLFFAAGLSGHGFKFAPVIGEGLANLALGRTQHIDLGYFSINRFFKE